MTVLRNRWLQTIAIATLTLIAVVACNNQPAIDSGSRANSPAADLSELEFGVGPYFPTPSLVELG